MKVVTIVGARPQFIKCAPVSRELRTVAIEVLIHTGQHYDDNMSQVFFDELNLPAPDYYLGVGSGLHGEQTGEMLKRIEGALLKEKPDYVLVYGDTNSTLAGALAAAKLHIPVAHVEAGLRSFNRRMPEEINRVITDHLSSLLFCPTETAVKNVTAEGISDGIHLVGDVMYDALLENMEIAERRSRILEILRVEPKSYALATVHRAENTDDRNRLLAILTALRELSRTITVVWPIHPRTREAIRAAGAPSFESDSLKLIDPASYLDMLLFVKQASVILTDSGGVQKEAYWMRVPCVTLREETEWVETLESGWNVLVGTDSGRILAAAGRRSATRSNGADLYGDGHSAQRIVQRLGLTRI